jgi:hypothetical protein
MNKRLASQVLMIPRATPAAAPAGAGGVPAGTAAGAVAGSAFTDRGRDDRVFAHGSRLMSRCRTRDGGHLFMAWVAVVRRR